MEKILTEISKELNGPDFGIKTNIVNGNLMIRDPYYYSPDVDYKKRLWENTYSPYFNEKYGVEFKVVSVRNNGEETEILITVRRP